MLETSQVLSSLLFLAIAYPFLLFSFTGSLNNPVKRKRGLFLSLIGLTIGLLRYDAGSSLSGNYYSVLEVSRQSSVLDIRKAYKALSKKYHPDKNPGSDAEAKFESIKTAYDVLMDESSRDIYNRFGTASLKFDPRKDELKLISEVGLSYLVWGLLAYIMTLPVACRAAKTWIIIAGIAVLSVEVCFSLTETAMPEWMRPSTLTEFELLQLLHSAFPFIIASLSALAMSLYVDIDSTTLAVLKEVFEHQRAMAELLYQVDQLAEIAKKPVAASADLVTVDSVRNRIIELREKMDSSGEDFGRRIEDLRAASVNPGSSYYWIIFVLLYGGVYFLQ
eukprot:scaffold2312_cov165-Ochromonas_danica.AAC.72